MMTSVRRLFLLVLALFAFSPSPLAAQTREAATVEDAEQVLREIMAIPARQIPASLLADAQGIAIVPDVLKGGFVLGVRHGRGVVLVRDANGGWQPPAFVSLTGGSIGWQAGLQATDVILVFKTRKSVQGLLGGKFTLGADAAVAAGPVGRQAAAATDTALRAEILSYSRSRGLFVGVSLDGSALRIDPVAGGTYYAGVPAAVGQPAPLPPSATRLMEQVKAYTTPATAVQPAAALAPVNAPLAAPGVTVTEGQARQQLADSARRLDAVLDDNWRVFLALPTEAYGGDRPPNVEMIGQSLGKFERVAGDPRYQALTQRPEFRATREALKRYIAVQTSRQSPTLALPPPPR
jgi:SH3 domain-containing YSC84-like protein 1